MDETVSNYPRAPLPVRFHGRTLAPCLRFAVYLLVLWAIPSLAVNLVFGIPITNATVHGYLGNCGLWWGATVVLAAIFNHFYPITLSADGLKSYNGLGVYSTIPWNEVELKRPLNFIGIKYHRFKMKSLRFAMIVPFDLDDPKRFVEELTRYLGPTHPIVLRVRAAWKMPPTD